MHCAVSQTVNKTLDVSLTSCLQDYLQNYGSAAAVHSRPLPIGWDICMPGQKTATQADSVTCSCPILILCHRCAKDTSHTGPNPHRSIWHTCLPSCCVAAWQDNLNLPHNNDTHLLHLGAAKAYIIAHTQAAGRCRAQAGPSKVVKSTQGCGQCAKGGPRGARCCWHLLCECQCRACRRLGPPLTRG